MGEKIARAKGIQDEKGQYKGRKDEQSKRGRVQDPSSSLFTRHLVAISASHRKGRPCLAGAPGSGSSSLPLLQKQQSASALHCSAVQCNAVQSGPSQPKLNNHQQPRIKRSHPSKTSKEEHRATSHSYCLCLPRSTGNGKKEGENRELLSLEAA